MMGKKYNNSVSTRISVWSLNILFVLLISLPSLCHLGGYSNLNYIYDTEKRSPNEVPKFPEHFKFTRSYVTDLENYLKDHFGFRSQLIRLNNLIRYKLNFSGSEQVLLGKEHWMFLTHENMINQYRGIKLFTDDELDQWTDAMEARNQWLKERNIPFILVIIPNTCTVYSEFLPSWVTKVTEKNQFVQLSDHIQSHSQLNFIDLTETMKRSKSIYPVYYKTDSHWNFHGGFVGYRAIMKSIEKYFPGIYIINESEAGLSFQTGEGRDLAALLNLSQDIGEPYNDQSQFDFDTNVKSKKNLDETGRKFIVETNRTGAPKALIFHDSFTDLMIPYFNQSFSSILYAQHEHNRFDMQMIESFKPDIVLHIIVERLIQYMPYNIDSNRISITDWGPRETSSGKTFNTLPSGESSLWIVANNITSKTIIVWEETHLLTTTAPERSVATASIPSHLYKKKGLYKIYLLNPEAQQKSNTVTFQVMD